MHDYFDIVLLDLNESTCEWSVHQKEGHERVESLAQHSFLCS